MRKDTRILDLENAGASTPVHTSMLRLVVAITAAVSLSLGAWACAPRLARSPYDRWAAEKAARDRGEGATPAASRVLGKRVESRPGEPLMSTPAITATSTGSRVVRPAPRDEGEAIY